MSHKEKVLELLSDGQPHLHLEGYRLGVMLHSRVADLRKDGHQIECRWTKDGWEYQLVSLEGAAAIPEETAAPSSEPTEAPPAARSQSEQLALVPTTEAPPWA